MKSIYIQNSLEKPRHVTIKQVEHFVDYLSANLSLSSLRQDPNTSYLFGIHRAIQEKPLE
jgi:hypothetical protein